MAGDTRGPEAADVGDKTGLAAESGHRAGGSGMTFEKGAELVFWMEIVKLASGVDPASAEDFADRAVKGLRERIPEDRRHGGDTLWGPNQAAPYDEERKPAEPKHLRFYLGQRVQHIVTGLRGTVTGEGLRKDGDDYSGWWAPECWVALEEEKPAESEPGRQAPAAVPAPKRTCNRHFDCEAAEKALLEANPQGGQYIPPSFHCHDDECEDCFGK